MAHRSTSGANCIAVTLRSPDRLARENSHESDRSTDRVWPDNHAETIK